MIGGGSLDNVPIGQLYNDLECEFILFVFLAIDINFIWEISALINDSVRLHFPLYSLKNYPLSGFVYQYIYRCFIELMHPLKSVYRIHTLYQMSWITAWYFHCTCSAVLLFLCHYGTDIQSIPTLYWKRILFMFFTDLILFSRYHLPLSKVFFNLEKSIHLCLCKFYI